MQAEKGAPGMQFLWVIAHAGVGLSDVAAPVSHGHQLAKLDLGRIISLVYCGSVEVLTSQIRLPHRAHVMIHMPVSVTVKRVIWISRQWK